MEDNTDQLLSSQKASFSIPDGVSYLNCAYMSPLSNEVIAMGQKSVLLKARPYEICSRDFFEPVEQLKKEFSGLIGADNPQRIVVVPSASYGFSTIAANLTFKQGQNMIMLEEQFPSNVYCWQRLCRSQKIELRVVSSAKGGQDWNQAILDSIDANTALVTMGIVHWRDGTVFDLEAIRTKTFELGAKLILDGTQAIGALPFNVDLLKPDALICAAYKWLMGPYSIGLSYFGEAWDRGIPLEENWINRVGSDDFQAQVGYQEQYRPYSTRFDMGEKSNFIHIPMLTTAIKQVRFWGESNIQKYCQNISEQEIKKLQNLGFNIEEPPYRAHHIIGIKPPPNFEFGKLNQALTAANAYVSFRGDSIRVSPHVYNTVDDFEKLSDCLVQGLA